MKVLIVVPSFNNGGTITSLNNLVSTLDLSRIQIDVYAITNLGANRSFISRYTNVLGIGLDNIENISLIYRLKIKLFKFVKALKKVLENIGVDITPLAFKCEVFKLEKNNYDYVIGFQEGQATKFISYFNNGKKIAWIRSDYGNMLRISKEKPQRKLYSKIDKIICVSEYTKNVFINLVPDATKKTIALHNLISDKIILEKSKKIKEIDKIFDYHGFKIVSIGRIDPVKRFTMIPKIVSKIKEKGYHFKWYIIGGGTGKEEELLKRYISKYAVQEELNILGEKNNPYPYIKEADLLVSTSLSEACPNVINEAKILGTPVVSTDFGSVFEFIEDNVTGLISPIETISDKIEQMISDKIFYTRIKSNISQFKYKNDDILEVWYKEILVTE